MRWVLGTVTLLVVVAVGLGLARDASLARRIGREVNKHDESSAAESD
ncbi:hypothetical protein AB0C29_26610 [Actinoplanes sp. NPDC048791]